MTVKELPGRSFSGTITRSTLALDPSTRSLLVEIDLPNPDHALRPGTFAEMTLGLREIPNALVLPPQAVISTVQGQGRSSSWNKAKPRRCLSTRASRTDNGSKLPTDFEGTRKGRRRRETPTPRWQSRSMPPPSNCLKRKPAQQKFERRSAGTTRPPRSKLRHWNLEFCTIQTRRNDHDHLCRHRCRSVSLTLCSRARRTAGTTRSPSLPPPAGGFLGSATGDRIGPGTIRSWKRECAQPQSHRMPGPTRPGPSIIRKSMRTSIRRPGPDGINPRFLIAPVGSLQPNLSPYAGGVLASQRIYDFGFTQNSVDSAHLGERARSRTSTPGAPS